MLRLPATAIVLGRADIKDFESRRKYAAEAVRLDQESVRNNNTYSPVPQVVAIRVRDKSLYGSVEQLAVLETYVSTRRCNDDSTDVAPQHVDSDNDSFPSSTFSSSSALLVSKSAENTTNRPVLLSATSKDDFGHSGFMETPERKIPEIESHLILDTEQVALRLPYTEPRGLRNPPARSPLFISHNASYSPERTLTSSLTPRLTSRVASHSTPSILFSQPARRVPRSARALRHQTNSFSFDSSERASAAYEQERAFSSSTANSRPWSVADASLHEELNGSALLLESDDSDDSSTRLSSEFPPSLLNESSSVSFQSPSLFTQQVLVLSSPQLPLPPPFSMSSRTSSRSGTMPSDTTHTIQHPRTSPIRLSTPSPLRRCRVWSTPAMTLGNDSSSIPPTTVSSLSFFERAARVIAEYRVRTPPHPHSLDGPPTTPPLPTRPPFNTDIRIPSATYRVYNDSLPPSSQPQTPANLPESRHQSRYHPSFTMPANAHARQRAHTSRGDASRRSTRRQLSFATPSRRQLSRSDSPSGLRSVGFEGLYGGRENGDEEQNWSDGITSNNAGVRLWSLRDARDDGRSMRDTPEPEDWRAIRRN